MRTLTVVLVGVWVMTGSVYGASVQSTFDSDLDGWQVVNLDNSTPPALAETWVPTYNPTGGNPGGYISSQDVGNWTFYFSAPSKFLGDRSSAYGGCVYFGAKDNGGTRSPGPELVLTGGGNTLLYFGDLDATDQWSTFAIPLSAGPNWYINGSIPAPGSLASEAEIRQVLSSLDGLYIYGDWTVFTDNSGLDNVQLAEVPEPIGMTVLALFVGTGTLLRKLRLRRLKVT